MSMVIGILQFELIVRGSNSLKDKRRVVKSVKDRLHREHLVSIAEIGALEHHRLALMGISVVSNSTTYVNSVLDRIVTKLRRVRDAELGEVLREVLPTSSLDWTAGEPQIEPLWSESDRRPDSDDLAQGDRS